ncbi:MULTISPECIES: penicillin-binding protein 2 [unclassified Campylobacter]|uniref:penicillin-binding protein 2 n=1 Tax=unclassified Campylobacter TaxID=2593542 RepID=UPI0022E9F87D|nr:MULTISPECIES: penicillin-binding protein 2 [unclassified Campylobacter]MDA3054167.1 penicillin-binding protein 2 [Campylobacter sp. VBCF_07 NA4]MDA3060858.1 penicillin-binding protein 2 [Campylobacter sp. VBCF_02 NA5]MDA3070371.1 penicillin-binding protein 2 [Campylobacter sp. VBCF_08 NA3]WBR53682.1 penicillin-binding protein 2 [Campylobacter sp. VBCF_01 NA2]
MRLKFVFFFVLAFFTMLLVRVYYLAIKSNEFYEQIAKNNVVSTEYIPPVRGQILDAKNRPLAINNIGFSLLIAPHLKDSALDAELANISKYFADLNTTQMRKIYKDENSVYNQNFIEVVKFLDYNETITHFANLNLHENIRVEPASQRYYPHNHLASHIIGYVGRANKKDIKSNPLSALTGYNGRSGVEGYYNEILQGKRGERKTKVTALNEVVEEISYEEPSSSEISLTIDLEFQRYLEEIFKDKDGVAIVIDLKDGAILGAGSFPEYNLNTFVGGISQAQWDELIKDPRHPFTNKLVNGLYPPGSVIKMAVGMSFLNSGKINENWSAFCGGAIELGGRRFRCWSSGGHGRVSLVQAIKSSCDIYFYEGSLIVGIDYMSAYLNRMGYGVKTGVDLPNEFVGTMPNKAWKMQKFKRPWYQGETVNASIGQGDVLVTPMQVAKNTAQIATGKAIIPHFLKSIDGEEISFEPGELFTPAEKNQLPLVRRGMYEVGNNPNGGTAYKIMKDAVVPLAVKTGTAQVVGLSQKTNKRLKESQMDYFHRSHAWMTSFGPYENPKYAVTVLVEHGGGGGSAAGPVVKKIFEKLVDMGYIDANATANSTQNLKKK